MTSQELKEKILSDPGASYWLQEAVKKADSRDCVDAVNDAEVLLQFCETKCNEALGIKEK